MKTSYSQELVFFLHIQKTAGMTLQELLRKNLGRPPLKRLTDFLTRQTGEGLPLRQSLARLTAKDRLFMGHFGHGVHRLYPHRSTYITFLREPTSRLLSLYYFSRTTPHSFYHQLAKGRSLEAFLLETELHELDNGMTRQIAGDPEDLFLNRTPFRECKESLLDQAITNLENDFAFVGIQELFLESVCLLGKTLHFKDPYFLTFNRTKATRPEVDESVLHRVREKNELDYRLYAYCRERFEAALNRLQTDNPEAIPSFAKANEAQQGRLQRAYRARIGLRRALETVTLRKRRRRVAPG